MENEKLLEECKKGLGISIEPNEAIDGLILQKLMTVKLFMKGSGVPDEKLDGDLAIGVIVMGVTDLWELKSGEVKFSPAFFTLVTQLAVG
ncbi:hypothetical protein [Virgibacillus salexigens]|uniref:hypothetical protein n=1 Tax=Virgibacillus salexigens TaxID=61016 RepID=UPI00190D606D|nr:hypothetical protein [Virgibacillus salexigens]